MTHSHLLTRTPVRITLALALLLLLGPVPPAAHAARPHAICPANSAAYTGRQSSGAYYVLCVPTGHWNGDLLVYAHGYISPAEPVRPPHDRPTVDGDLSLWELLLDLGYAWAASSFAANGLAVQEGLADSVELVALFSERVAPPRHVYLAGPSLGGLIAVLGIERHPDVFDGALSACGPIGDFHQQINYWGDVRVLTDYFYPGLLPRWAQDGAPPAAPPACEWEPQRTMIRAALLRDAQRTETLLRVASVPHDADDMEEGVDALLAVLWYPVHATADAVSRLGGQPYDNRARTNYYTGSDDDSALNRQVARFVPNAAALQAATAYQPSGRAVRPLVTLHNTSDPVVPYWQATRYSARRTGNAPYLRLAVPRHGHCHVSALELMAAFAWLVYQVTGAPPQLPEDPAAAHALLHDWRAIRPVATVPLAPR